jgi:hypothetical protein
MARHSAGAMHGAHMAWPQCGGLFTGGSGIILDLVGHMPGGTILDILRADKALNTWFVVMIFVLGLGALTLHSYDLQRVLIWIAVGWFALGGLLLGYRGAHL